MPGCVPFFYNQATGPGSGPKFKRDRDWDQSLGPEMSGARNRDQSSGPEMTGTETVPGTGLGPGTETFSGHDTN